MRPKPSTSAVSIVAIFSIAYFPGPATVVDLAVSVVW